MSNSCTPLIASVNVSGTVENGSVWALVKTAKWNGQSLSVRVVAGPSEDVILERKCIITQLSIDGDYNNSENYTINLEASAGEVV